MRIVFLCSGENAERVLRKLETSRTVHIIAIGVPDINVKYTKSIVNFSRKKQIPLVYNLRDLRKYLFDYVCMFNYPTLIEPGLLKKYTFINIHYAPLPRYRGYHGLVWSIINGETKVGYTIHLVDKSIDGGPVFYQYLTRLKENDDINSVKERLDRHLVENIEKILIQMRSNKTPKPQYERKAIYVTKRKPADGLIDWKHSSRNIFNLIRALKPPFTPGAFTFYKKKRIYVVDAYFIKMPRYIGIPGKVVNRYEEDGKILVKTGDSVIAVKKVIYNGLPVRPTDLIHKVGVLLG